MFNEVCKKNHSIWKLKEVDCYNDEEQATKFEEIIIMFISAGYYRARIKGLGNFDKIVGGMTWCIESCYFDVDVDILFQENLTIGKKIALTEKIVSTLPKMNCPYSIEPHQIQGLDLIHIFPVIEWLVKESIRTKEIMAHLVHLFAVNQFNNEYVNKNNNKNNMEDQNMLLHLKETKNQVSWNICKRNVLSQEKSAVVAPAVLRPTEFYQDKETKPKNLRVLLKKLILHLQNQKKQMINDKSCCINKVTKISEHIYRLKRNKNLSYGKLEEVKVPENIKILVNLKRLLAIHDALRDDEAKFREQCRLHLNFFSNITEKFTIGDIRKDENLIHKYKKSKEIICRLRLLLAKRNRLIASVSRQLDDVPSRSELTQYQRRFMELYNQVAMKHKETKQYYTLYNTLDDTKLYFCKELSLLDSIQDYYSGAMTSNNGREQFIRQFQVIINGVLENKQKIECKLLEERNRRDILNQHLMFSLEQQRKYIAAVKQLTVECRKNEILLLRLRE